MKLLALVLSFFTMTLAAHAERLSFAAAISPEQAFEICQSADVPSAVSCALDKCRKAGGDDCVVTSACTNGWAGSMGVTTSEIHWTETVCGAPSEAAAVSALRAFCKGGLPYVTECYLSQVWSDDGKTKSIEKTIDPKKIK